jgi:hypothetical protein
MNLKEVLNELGILFKGFGEHHHCSSPDWKITDCPYCSPDSGRYRLGFNTRFNYASCWVCGHRNLYETLALLSGKEAGLSALLKGLSKERREKIKHTGKLQLPTGLGNLLPAHLRYLASRRIDSEALTGQWGVQGLGIAPALSWRLFIPITHQGEMVSWTTRAVGDNPVRYVNAREDQESMSMKHTLMGLDKCKHCILIVEGPMDVFRIGEGACATMGVQITREQMTLIAARPVRVVCLDNDEAGRKRATRLCRDLEGLEGQTHLVQLDSKDPAEASDKEINSIRKHFLE